MLDLDLVLGSIVLPLRRGVHPGNTFLGSLADLHAHLVPPGISPGADGADDGHFHFQRHGEMVGIRIGRHDLIHTGDDLLSCLAPGKHGQRACKKDTE